MPRRRHAIDASRHAARQSDLGADLGCRQYPAVAWLGTLAQLQLDHLNLITLRSFLEFSRAERSISVATTEISRTDFPDDVAPIFAMIGAVAAFAGVVGEIAPLGADVERADGVRA